MTTDIDIVLFDGFDEMDAIAPYEVFRTAANHGAPIRTELVGAHGPATITASHGTRVLVDRGPSPAADVLLVPGGGWFEGDGIRAEIERRELPRLIADAHARGTTVGSVCTGAMLLAATGLTAGRRATTHRFAIDDLRASGADIVDARFVDDGDIVTAAGVTAGLDLALHMSSASPTAALRPSSRPRLSTLMFQSTVSLHVHLLMFADRRNHPSTIARRRRAGATGQLPLERPHASRSHSRHTRPSSGPSSDSTACAAATSAAC
jgi:putative intracellular protease/amidase